MVSVADLTLKADFGFRAKISAAFPVLKPIAMLTFRAGVASPESSAFLTAYCYAN
jgi:hypothetical protein